MAAGSTAHPGKAVRSGRTHRREFHGVGNEVSQASRPGTRPVTRACTHKLKGVMYLAMSALRSEADTWAGLQRVCFAPIAGLHFLLPLLLPPNQIRPRRYVNFDLHRIFPSDFSFRGRLERARYNLPFFRHL